MASYAARLQRRASSAYFVFICLFSLSAFNLPASAQEGLAVPSAVAPQIVQPLDESRVTVLKGNTHRLARPQFDQGPAPSDLPMERMLLVLKRSPEQESVLRKLIDDQQDKGSPEYHKWLTPEQFGKKFGPADQDMQIVTAWLQAHGFRIGSVAKGRNIIEFSGTAAQVQEALHTSIHKYVVKGKEHWANSGDPQIPTALTPAVAGVHTLHNFLKQPQIRLSKEKFAAKYVRGKPPEVSFPNGLHALGPADYATIYNLNPLYKSGVNGAAITVAVVARSNLFEGGADVTNFCSIFGPSTVGCGFPDIVLNGPDPGDLGGGEEGEATLDATWSGAIAPGANIDFVVSATTNSTDGVDLSEAYIIDNNFADVMTESFGGCEAAQTNAEAQGVATLAEQAAAQGITYLVSTGDAGAEGCDSPNAETVATGPVSVNILASTPYTVAVGGTMFNENGQNSKYWGSTNSQQSFESALSYIPENVWNESCTAAQCGSNANIGAGSGGFSTFFTKPSWQSGVSGIPQDGARDIPDVSLTAAGHDPYLLCLAGSCVADSNGDIFFAAAAGTSASTPSFAGIMALVNQKMNSRQGQAGYVLYKLAAAESLTQCNASNTSTPPASTCIFNDVTVGNNAVPGEVGYGNHSAAYQSGFGYDLATGLGSVNVANLVNKWDTVTFNPSATTLSMNPTTITHGQSVSVNITVAPQNGSGTPTGDVSLLNVNAYGLTNSVALSSYTLSAGTLSATTTALPGGTYTLSAHYAGDGTYAPSDSAAFGPITVNSETSATTLSVFGYPNQNGVFPPFTGGPYGTFAYLRADVSSSTSKCPPDCGAATGNVNFLDNGVAIFNEQYGVTNFVLNSQGNTSTPNGFFGFGAGAHSVIASFLGDSSYQTSQSSPPYTFTMTQAGTTTTATAQGTTLAATVATSSGGSFPSGTVTFFEDGAQVGAPVTIFNFSPAVINPQTDAVITGASSTASLVVSNPPSKSFKATYNGDANYVASTSSSANVDFTLTSSVSTVTVASPGASGDLKLTVTALNGLPGTIQFGASSCTGLPSESACSFGPASLPGSGSTILTVTTKAATAGWLRHQRLRPEDSGWWIASSGLTLVGITLLGVPRGRRRGSALLSFILIALVSLVACGGGSSKSSGPPPDPGTPAGTYSVVVTATSGKLQHTANFSLIVQ